MLCMDDAESNGTMIGPRIYVRVVAFAAEVVVVEDEDAAPGTQTEKVDRMPMSPVYSAHVNETGNEGDYLGSRTPIRGGSCTDPNREDDFASARWSEDWTQQTLKAVDPSHHLRPCRPMPLRAHRD